MNKKDIKEIREQVMGCVIIIEKEVMAKGFKDVDGTDEITSEEAINMGKMLLLVDLVKGLENLFDGLEKK
jgi:hypothetical protein